MAALRKVEWSEVPDAASGSDKDRDLTLSFQRGEPDAYQCIYNRYLWSVYDVCYRILGNRDDAQEATQEAFLKVYQALGRFNGSYRLGPWIIRIATNVSLDHLRLRKRRPQDSVSIDALHQEPRAYAEGPEQILMERAEGDKVRQVLSSLPPAHRAAIVLRDYEGLTYREIALNLGISESQVKALLHRARKRFKRTWVPAPFLFPGHLLDRLRDHALTSRASDGLMGTTSPVANLASAGTSVTSSGLLEHVAGIASERIAPMVAAAVIGAATVGATVGFTETDFHSARAGRPPAAMVPPGNSRGSGQVEAGAPAKDLSVSLASPGEEGPGKESNRGDETVADEGKPRDDDAQITELVEGTEGSEGKDKEEKKDNEETVSGADPSGIVSLPGDGQELTGDPPPPLPECGQDNDEPTDLGDVGCANDPKGVAENSEPSPEPIPAPECSDGQDNDGDGLTDLDDAGCASSEAEAENSEQEASSTNAPG
ncbi:MAG: sigma-70 family RNA polymerase sigma factor [Actinomycetota bacterium]|nr:sigma-70 family RNA polymerase sigma factor [Actinomycetota bacterium]